MKHDTTEVSINDDYKKQQEAIKNKISEAAKKTDSEILKSKKKEENKDSPEMKQNCEMARMLLSEGLEMYQSGDMSFEEMVDDLHKAMMAISDKKMDDKKTRKLIIKSRIV